MLRQATRVLRRGLLLIGLVLLLTLPVTYFVEAGLYVSSPHFRPLRVDAGSGSVGLLVWKMDPAPVDPAPEWEVTPYVKMVDRWYWPLLPALNRDVGSGFSISASSVPLWLLSAICLAWPVTSFILARRRDKRGFPVEPKGEGETVSTPVSSS